MNRAQQMLEGIIGINMNPDQAGYVPTPPPRGSGEESEEEVNVPITIDRNNRRRQVKALNGIKRKFEARYGDVNEAGEDWWEKKKQEYENRYKSYADRPSVPVSDIGPKNPLPTSAELARRRREEANRRENDARDKAARLSGQQIPDRKTGTERLADLERQKYGYSGIKNWQATREREAQVKRERENARRAKMMYDYTQKAAARRDQRERTHQEYMKTEFEPYYNKEQERIKAEREAYLNRVRTRSRDSDLPEPEEQPSKWYNKKIGLTGIGRQKEADRIGHALIHKTQMKSVRIVPYGSGTRVEVNISNATGDSFIQLYLQKNLKMVLFSKIKARTPGLDKILERGISTILENVPEGWKVAVDPYLVQKSIKEDEKTLARSGAITLTNLMHDYATRKQIEIADRTEFNRVRNDFSRRTQSADNEPPSDSSTRRVEPEVLTPDEYEAYRRAKEQESEEEKRRKEAEWLQRKEREEQTRREAEFQKQWPEGNRRERTQSFGFGQDEPQYAGSDEDDYFRQQAMGGMMGGTSINYEPRSRPRIETPSRTDYGADYGPHQDPSWYASQTYDEPLPRERPRPERERTTSSYTPSETSDYDAFDDDEYEEPKSIRDIVRDKARAASAEEKHSPEEHQLITDARRDSVRRFDSRSPAVTLVYDRALRAFGSGIQIVDVSTSKVIVRAPNAIEMHLERKKGTTSGSKKVTMTFKKLGTDWRKVFASIPMIAFDPIMNTKAGQQFKVQHRTDLRPLFQEIKNEHPDLLIPFHNALESWLEYVKVRNKSGVGGIETILNALKSPEERKAIRNKKAKESRARNESLAGIYLQSMLNEQIWYKEIVPLAKKIQDWLLKSHMGGYQVTSEEIHEKFGEDHDNETIKKAIEILRANAVIYSMNNDVYMINMSRLSSALM